jgi:hypothetical protein
MIMSLNLEDTGCAGDHSCRNPWKWGLVETPLKHCCDKLYYVTHTHTHTHSHWLLTYDSPVNSSLPTNSLADSQLTNSTYNKLQLYNLGTDHEEDNSSQL